MASQLIERARAATTELRDAARLGREIYFHQRDPLVLAIHAALDALEAAETEIERLRAAAASPHPEHWKFDVWQSVLADIVAKWKKEANCYVSGAMMESPVGDMNRASATTARAILADLETLKVAAPAAPQEPPQ